MPLWAMERLGYHDKMAIKPAKFVRVSMECGTMAVLGAMVPGIQPKLLECGIPDTVLSKRVFKGNAIPSSLLLGRERDDSLEWCGFTPAKGS